MARRSLVERFWERFDRPADGCWEWHGCTDENGYGYIGRHGTGNLIRS